MPPSRCALPKTRAQIVTEIMVNSPPTGGCPSATSGKLSSVPMQRRRPSCAHAGSTTGSSCRSTTLAREGVGCVRLQEPLQALDRIDEKDRREDPVSSTKKMSIRMKTKRALNDLLVQAVKWWVASHLLFCCQRLDICHRNLGNMW